MAKLNFHCILTMLIPRLHYIFSMNTAGLSTIKLLDAVTSDTVNSFDFAMYALASKCIHIESVQSCDGQ